ncbi:MAG: lasso peptide biosynthesis B2 protein [Acidimicrobiales bacterium]
MSFRADVARIRNATPAELALLAEAFAWLGVMRLGLGTLRFRRLAKLLGLAVAKPQDHPRGQIGGRSERVGWAVRSAAARTPRLSTCLAQSLACCAMQSIRGVGGTLYLGVAKPDGHLAAHSWFECGDSVLTGEVRRSDFAPIAAYTSNPRRPGSPHGEAVGQRSDRV